MTTVKILRLSDGIVYDLVGCEAPELAAANAEIARLREELALVKCGEPNHPDRAYAMKGWLKTFGFKVYCELKQGDVGFVLSLLQSGEITRSKAAEAIAELLTGAEPLLPRFEGDVFAEDEMPRETVTRLREALRETRDALAGLDDEYNNRSYDLNLGVWTCRNCDAPWGQPHPATCKLFGVIARHAGIAGEEGKGKG